MAKVGAAEVDATQVRYAANIVEAQVGVAQIGSAHVGLVENRRAGRSAP